MTTYIKLVKGATKIKMAPPKAKYIDPILLGSTSEYDFEEIANALDMRLQDTAWTVVYKSLIVVHLLLREGEGNVAMKHYARRSDVFNVGRNLPNVGNEEIRIVEKYAHYLKCKSKEYQRIGLDYVRDTKAKIKINENNLSKVNTALDHVESIEVQISALVKNRYSSYDLENDLYLYAFRLLVQDLLALYNALNEGIISLLEIFFELSHNNAERTLKLYKRFVDLTETVVKYLKSGKQVGLKIPVIKHITTKLVSSLEEHLLEDEKTHQSFRNDNDKANSPSDVTRQGTIAQQRLEQVREQKRILEEKLKTQNIVFSNPAVGQSTGQQTVSNSIPTTTDQYNPFGQLPVKQQQQPQIAQIEPQITQIQPQFTQVQTQFTQVQPDYTQIHQQYTQPQVFQTQPLPDSQAQQIQAETTLAQNVSVNNPFATANPGLATAQTMPQMSQQTPMGYGNIQSQTSGFISAPQNNFTGLLANDGRTIQGQQQTQPSTINSQITPTYTGSHSQQLTQQPYSNNMQEIPSNPTGSNNPFALNNINKTEAEVKQMQTYNEQFVNKQLNNSSSTNNPFAAENAPAYNFNDWSSQNTAQNPAQQLIHNPFQQTSMQHNQYMTTPTSNNNADLNQGILNQPNIMQPLQISQSFNQVPGNAQPGYNSDHMQQPQMQQPQMPQQQMSQQQIPQQIPQQQMQQQPFQQQPIQQQQQYSYQAYNEPNLIDF
ncbi:Uncharacterized protein RNJ44_02510 [Nakaseomyces bracarensis]|uniref:ENTH domain-containing protein n=1 Tax=Nakaseomyces bracarensis TaxID=273131 RepID=A0ABR4NLY2_9SACH